MSEKYTSLSMLPAAEEQPLSRLTWDFPVPESLDTDRIELNTRKLARIQRVAAFSSMHVCGYDGELSTSAPNISGVHSDGTAVASKAISMAAERHRGHLIDQYDESYFQADYGKTKAVLGLNKSELVSRVVDRKQSGFSREEAWAAELNDAVNGAIEESAKKHLISRKQPLLKEFGVLMTGFNMANASLLGYLSRDPSLTPLVAGSMALGPIAAAGLTRATAIRLGYELSLKDRRWSIFPFAFQADRYLAATALLNASKTVRVAK